MWYRYSRASHKDDESLNNIGIIWNWKGRGRATERVVKKQPQHAKGMFRHGFLILLLDTHVRLLQR